MSLTPFVVEFNYNYLEKNIKEFLKHEVLKIILQLKFA